MPSPSASPYLVPFDGSFRVADAPTVPPKDAPKKKDLEQALAASVAALAELQQKLYAQNTWAILLIFQAMDAAGKDGTIRSVLTGVDPAGCQVCSFKAPSAEELDHDFLWRTATRLPERGRIGVFNRSYYEEVLVVRVHPEFLAGQRLPEATLKSLWSGRFDSIRDHERHLARNGVHILKFWLNVSEKEQHRRLLKRIEDPSKNWKFNAGDLDERDRWSEYMSAYEAALGETSRPWAPWYAIPADDKAFMRATVANILVESLNSLDLAFPSVSTEQKAVLKKLGAKLKNGR